MLPASVDTLSLWAVELPYIHPQVKCNFAFKWASISMRIWCIKKGFIVFTFAKCTVFRPSCIVILQSKYSNQSNFMDCIFHPSTFFCWFPLNVSSSFSPSICIGSRPWPSHQSVNPWVFTSSTYRPWPGIGGCGKTCRFQAGGTYLNMSSEKCDVLLSCDVKRRKFEIKREIQDGDGALIIGEK